MGTSEFAVPCLRALVKSGITISAVVTVPDKPAGRGLRPTASPVKLTAAELELPVLQPDDLRDSAFIAELGRREPDVGLVVSFRILPPEVYTLPRLGCVNLHASLLPELRGAAPINWALILGLERTGVTTFLIERTVDTGGVLLQREVAVLPDDDAGSLGRRLSEVGAEVAVETLHGYVSGALQPRPQTGTPSRAPKITPELCRLDWSRPGRELHNLVRGLSPAPAAYTLLDGRRIKIYKTKPVAYAPSDTPGVAVWADGALRVSTGEGALEILELQAEGGRRMTAADFARGRRFRSGTTLRFRS